MFAPGDESSKNRIPRSSIDEFVPLEARRQTIKRLASESSV